MAVPGIIMRMAAPRASGGQTPTSNLAPPAPCPKVEAYYIFEGRDDETPKYNTAYFLSDITPVLNSSSYYEEDIKVHSGGLTSLAWEVCAFIKGRDSSEAKELSSHPHLLPTPPAIGSTVVSNGGTPSPGWEQDYEDWYNSEHSGLLSLVPGWNNCRRYRHIKTYGNMDIATVYGWNYYDAENGLGGPEWQASMTPWTKKVRGNAAKPNLRRVWKVLEVHHP